MFAEALAKHAGFSSARLIMLQTIQKIGSELVLRSGDVVAIRLQAALQNMLPGSPGSGGGGGELRASQRDRAADRNTRASRRASGEGADRGDATFRGPQRSGFCIAPSRL
jgi:hypothetical protein